MNRSPSRSRSPTAAPPICSVSRPSCAYRPRCCRLRRPTPTARCAHRGASFSCDNLERAIWTIGNLAAGHGVTLNIPPVVLSGQTAPRSGTLISFDVEVVATDAPQPVAAQRHRRDQSWLELELDLSPQPVAHGALLTYSLSFGNRSVGQLAAATHDAASSRHRIPIRERRRNGRPNGVVTWLVGRPRSRSEWCARIGRNRR